MNDLFTNFSFYFPTEICFGTDSELKTGELVKKYGGHKALIIITGDFIKTTGLYDRVVRSLQEQGITSILLEGVQPNPRLSLVYKGLEIVKENEIDFILAIGGGSTIDTAKTIALGMVYDGDVWDLYEKKAKVNKIAPVGVISTIASSGSETSGGTVIYDDVKTHVKTGVMGNFVRARFAVMNPELSYSTPSFQTASGAVDIFAHAADTFLTYEKSFLGDMFCLSAMKTAVRFGPIALAHPRDYEARAELMLAASFAQNDTCRIGRSRSPMSGGGHNLERMSGLFDTTHGAGLAVMLPTFLQSLLDRDDTVTDRLAFLAKEVFDVQDDDPKTAAQKGIDRFREWIREMDLPTTLHELLRRDVTDEDIDLLVRTAWFTADGSMRAYGHSNRDDVRKMYESVR